jgi:RNA polymerase subunit RPABC4/transcription elongation factor Spt4
MLIIIVYFFIKEYKLCTCFEEDVKKCTSCGYKVKEEYIYCPNCKERLKKECENCKRLIDINWRKCPYCK